MESNFGLFQFESQLCRRSFGVKIRGSTPEKPGFHLSSCNMQLLANYTTYYTVFNSDAAQSLKFECLDLISKFNWAKHYAYLQRGTFSKNGGYGYGGV